MRVVATLFLILAGLVAAESAQEQIVRSVELEYRFVVRRLPAGARQVVAYVPVPPSNLWQDLAGYRVEAGYPFEELVEPQYGNRCLRFDLSGATGDVAVAVMYRVKRRADGPAPPTERPTQFLAPDRLVPVDGKIAEEAQRVAGEITDPLRRARRLFDHVVATVRYDKSGQGWGRGDAVYACDVRSGNCTDFHSLFIGEARALGIPARFIMGVPLPEGKTHGAIPGYHCWAEFFVDGVGWIPVDASEASKFPERKDAFFGGLDANRIQFSVGRDITLPDSQSGPVNYLIYPHVEVDGTVHGHVETQFSFTELPAEGILATLQAVRAPAVVAWLVLLLAWESAAPFFDYFRRWTTVRAVHAARNLAVGFINNLVASFGFVALWTLAAQWSEAREFGLLHRLGLPPWGHALGAVLILDAWTYGWHWLNHRVPFLWRFHRVHHSDPNMDVTTASRFHVGEITFSSVLRLPIIALVGVQLGELVVYETAMFAVVQFHHANVGLPERLDRVLRLLIVTPAMHKVHHSRFQPETDSNFTAFLSVWDRLFGTFRLNPRPESIQPGLAEFDDARDQQIAGLVLGPFRASRRVVRSQLDGAV